MNRQRGNRFVVVLATVTWMGTVSLFAPYALAQSQTGGETSAATDNAAREYFSANGLLNRGLNELAVDEYRKFLTAHADHEKADLARYGLGVALFRMKEYDKAAESLKQIAAKEDFQFAAERWLVLGQCELAQQHYAESAAAFQNVVDHHADHASADAAAALLCESRYRANQYKEARAACTTLIEKWPKSAYRERAQFFAGLAAMAQEDYVAAARILKDMRDRFPDGQFIEQSSLLLAQAWHRAGERDSAVRQYREVIQAGKDDAAPDALFGLASLLHGNQQNKEAADALDQLLAKYPDHQLAAAALMERGRIGFEGQQYENALDFFQRAKQKKEAPADEAAYWIAKCQLRLQQFANAITTLDGALKEYPQSKLKPEMMYDRAVSLARGSDDAKSAPALAEFRSAFPEHSLVPDAIYLQATIEHNRQNYKESRALCAEYQQRFADHALKASVAFLVAENDLLSENLEQAIAEYRDFISKFPKDAQIALANYRLGSALYRTQKLDESRAALQKIASGTKTPEQFRRAVFMLGDIAFQQQHWQDASAALSDYLTFGNDQPFADDACLKVGLARLRMNQSEQAIKSFDQVIAQFPQSAHRIQAQFERGQIFLSKNDLDAASEAFQKTLEADPKSRFAPYAINHLAGIAMQKQDYKAAAELYQQVNGDDADLAASAMYQRGVALMATTDLRGGADVLEQFVKQYPQHQRVPEAMARRAIAVARLADHEAGLRLIEQVEQKPSDALDASLLATLKYEKAWCLRNLNRTDDAITAYTQLIDAYSAQPIALNAMLELAELHTNAKRLDAAASLLTKLVDRTASADASPDLAEQALYRLMACKYELEQFKDAADLGEQFIARFPKSALLASAHLFSGESELKTEKPQQAAAHFAAIVEKYPDDPSCATSMLRLGECQAADQKWNDSEQTFATFLKKYPDSDLWFQAQFGIAWARENQKQFDQAVAAYRQVIERHTGPTAARAQFQIGECLYARKQYEEAVRELLKVDILYAYPEWSAAALYEAGRCFEELSKVAEATAQFQQVRDRFPKTRWAEMASKRIETAESKSAAAGQ